MSEPREAWINPNDYEWSSTEDEGFAKYILFSEYETLRTENEALKSGAMPPVTYKILHEQLERLLTENERLVDLAAKWKQSWSDVDIQLQSEREKVIQLQELLADQRFISKNYKEAAELFKADRDAEKEKVTKLRAALEYLWDDGNPEWDRNPNIYIAMDKARSVLAEIGDEK